jgi:hypothetical protein
MVFTNAFSAHAAVLHAHHTGGTLKSTLDQLFCFNHTDGWPTRVMSAGQNVSTLSTTP